MTASQPPPVNVDTLVARAIDARPACAEELILLYRQRIARFAIAQTGDTAHYEDICQTVFVKMVLALPEAARNRAVRTLAVSNSAQRMPRSSSRAAALAKAVHTFRRAARGGFQRVKKRQTDPRDMRRHIERLPEAQRSLLRLSLDDRKSYEDMARLTDTSVSSVKSRLHRARENLRSLILMERLQMTSEHAHDNEFAVPRWFLRCA
ncbi:MAG: sigma-70 family RNA polymerase sigma factor [Rhizomicrobium sp.]